jgi:CubicO group peptidase (beta-lactamase class C family)
MKSYGNKFLLLIFSVIYLSCFQPEKETTINKVNSNYAATTAFARKKIDKIVRKHHLPSIAVAVIDDQKVIFQFVEGMANIDRNIPATADTYYKIWSVAKTFTAIEIFRELEEGLIDLDAPITNYLPDFSIQSRFEMERPITIRNLLAHRSGLPRNECVSEKDGFSPYRSLQKFERLTHDCYMAFLPETRYKYSNLGYDLLGRIVEERRNAGFARYMKDSLLHSLRMMKSTFNSGDIASHEIVADGYEYYKREYFPLDQKGNISSVPSGNLYTTLGDLTIFVKTVLANENIFRKSGTLPLMFEDHYSSETDPETMGLGWKTIKILDSELMVWHDGGPDDGTGALIALLPERRVGMVLISNSMAFGGNVSVPFAKELFEKMLAEKFGMEKPDSENKRKLLIEKDVLQRYAGKYVAFGQMMEIQVKNKKLKGSISGIGLDLVPTSKTQFKVTHWMHKIGLTKIFKPPVDLDKLSVYFTRCGNSDSYTLIINLDNISYEICPKYPVSESLPESWASLIGDYKIAERKLGNKVGDRWNGNYTIELDENILTMSHPFGPILPEPEQYIIISGGPFAGETMEYDSVSGHIIHQNAVFIP